MMRDEYKTLRIVFLIGLILFAAYFIRFQIYVCPYQANGTDLRCGFYRVEIGGVLWLLSFFDIHGGGVTAVATGFIAWFTYSLRKSSIEQGRLTEKSIDIANRSLTELEGAYLYPMILGDRIHEHIKHFKLYDHETSVISPQTPEIVFTFKNFGRSPCFPKNISTVFFWGEPDDRHNDRSAGLFHQAIIGPNEISDVHVTRTMITPITKESYSIIESGYPKIYLRGRVIYQDIFSNIYEQTFCFAWDFQQRRFMVWRPDLNVRQRIRRDPQAYYGVGGEGGAG